MTSTDDVLVCENYLTCDTPPFPVVDLVPPEWSVCKEGLPMTRLIQSCDWPHRWRCNRRDNEVAP